MKPSQNDKSGARSDLGERALAFLAQHRLSASPINYWVAHDYIRGNDPSLCEALNSVIGSSSAIDDFVVREIYEQHVAGEALRRFHGMGEGIEKLLGSLLGDVLSASRNTSGLQASLTENLGRLDEVRDSSGLRAIAQNLAQAALAANESNAALKKSLEATEQETRLLRGELDKHRREAMVDPLTGLLNRRGMLIEAAKLFDSSDGPPALLVMDIDHFKRINDTWGHLAGDDLLCALAAQLRVVVGGRAMACRLGGDELMLMLPGTSLHAAVELAEGLRRRFEREPVVADGKPMSATLSLGIAAFPDHGDNARELLLRADQALYQAKLQGRNQVVAADAPDGLASMASQAG